LFIKVYKALPASAVKKEDINLSNNIVLPPSALTMLTYLGYFENSKNPIFFRILNIFSNVYTHCRVYDFTADEEYCYLPNNIFDRLGLEKNQKVNVRTKSLKPGQSIKLQPHKKEFIENPYHKIFLEYYLRNYFCLTEGDIISVKFREKIYQLDVLSCLPEKAINISNEIIRNLEINFSLPKDYKEPENIIKLEPLTKEEIVTSLITDNNFRGHYSRMDGKEVTLEQAKQISKKIYENNK